MAKYSMKSTNDPLPWVERAEEDFQLCTSSVKRKAPLTYGATFHAQQCAEKYVKALLTFRQIAFPHTHDLAALFYLCQQHGVLIPVSEDSMEILSAYSVEVRYPGLLPTLEEAKEAIRIAKIIRKFSRKFLGL